MAWPSSAWRSVWSSPTAIADGLAEADAAALGAALGEALADGLGLAGASAGATRTRCAWVASQLTSLNGPVPIGCVVERVLGERRRRDAVEDVVGQERLGGGVQEAADRRGQVEAHRVRSR